MAARRPVIGVVAHGHHVPKPFGLMPVHGVVPTYLAAVDRAGGRPVVLAGRYAAEQLDLVDALLLTGGGDVAPARYGGDEPARDVDDERDEAEIAVAGAAVRAGVPVLGVCRGMQVLAVAFGGTLRGGLDHEIPHGGHEVTTAPGSLVARLLGEHVRTSALHRQAVLAPGARLRATAWTADGTIEAIEPVSPDITALGVQWHPELGPNSPVGDATGAAVFGWLCGVAAQPSRTSRCVTVAERSL